MNNNRCVKSLASIFAIVLCFYNIPLAQAKDWFYEVREGDNLWNITDNHLIDISYVNRLKKLNNIDNPWRLKPGTKITIPGNWIKHFPSIIRVQALRGNASILEDGADQPRLLNKGDIVVQGDTVTTDAGSSLLLAFLDGTRVLLLEKSRLKMDHLSILEYTGLSNSFLQLETGRLETQVTPKKESIRRFEIKTPHSVTSVRGTDYRISAKQEESRAEVLTGLVNVKEMGKTRALPTGFGVLSAKNTPPQATVKLLPAPDLSQLPKVFNQLPISFSLPILADKQSYRVQISKTTLFQTILFDKLFSSENIRLIDLPDDEFTLRVRTLDEQQLEGFNAQQQIVINTQPEAPFLLTPQPNEGIILSDKVKFTWSQHKKHKRYHLQVAKDKEFTNVVIDKKNINKEQFIISSKQATGIYFWRVATIDEKGDGPFSGEQVFRRVLPAPKMGEPEISDEFMTIRAPSRGSSIQSYHFQMAKNKDFKELLVDERLKEPLLKIATPDSGQYFIRMRTIGSDGFVGPFLAPQVIKIPFNYYWLLSLLPLLALIAL